MTFRSLFLEEHNDEGSARKTYDPRASSSVAVDLNAYTWPNSALAFAELHDLPVDYVDNAWLRVVVSAPMARRFLESGTPDKQEAHNLVDRIRDGCWYVVNEEEF